MKVAEDPRNRTLELSEQVGEMMAETLRHTKELFNATAEGRLCE